MIMMSFILIIGLSFILLLHIALENWVRISDSKEFKKFLKTLKEGNVYNFVYSPSPDDPFDEDFRDTITILQVKENRYKETWVKFKFSDGSETTKSARELYRHIN
jgi:hypothetical protein